MIKRRKMFSVFLIEEAFLESSRIKKKSKHANKLENFHNSSLVLVN